MFLYSYFVIFKLVETMHEQCLGYFKQFRKKFQLSITSYEPHFSSFFNKLNYAYASYTSKIDHCFQSNDNGHFQVLVEVSKDIAEAINKMSPKSYIVSCLLSNFKFS